MSNDIWLYGYFFTSIARMPLLAPALDNAYPLFALVITPGFYLHHEKVADQGSAGRQIMINNTALCGFSPVM